MGPLRAGPVIARDIETVAGALVEELAGQSDGDVRTPVRFWGHTYMVMVGPHADDGLCWCQPPMVRCPHGLDGHSHPAHQDRRN